jgi:hypothetical protein
MPARIFKWSASPEEGKKTVAGAPRRDGPYGVLAPRLEGLGDRRLCPNRAPRRMYYRGQGPPKRGTSATSKIAAGAVKGVYQHVSSNEDAQCFEQRKELAEKLRSDSQCPSASPADALHTGP